MSSLLVALKLLGLGLLALAPVVGLWWGGVSWWAITLFVPGFWVGLAVLGLAVAAHFQDRRDRDARQRAEAAEAAASAWRASRARGHRS